jgi:hypothetical protein
MGAVQAGQLPGRNEDPRLQLRPAGLPQTPGAAVRADPSTTSAGRASPRSSRSATPGTSSC